MLRRLGIFAALALLVFLLLPRTDDDKSAQPDEQNLSAQQETEVKESLITDDMTATDQLCRNQCAFDLKKAGAIIKDPLNRQHIQAALRSIQEEHPHMVRLIYQPTQNGHATQPPVSVGELPSPLEQGAKDEIATALLQSAQGVNYQSPPISTVKGTYFVMGIPADDGQGSIVGIVHQHILQQVREHQVKNLRLVPYPAEGNWKIESVDTDTLRDKSVNKPEDNEGTSHYKTNQVVVKFRSQPTEQQLQQIAEDLQAGPAQRLGYTYVFESKGNRDAKQMMDYFKGWDVEYAEPHYLYITNDEGTARNTTDQAGYDASSAPNDALYSRYQWNLPIIETLRGWSIAKGSEDVKVAVIDTGIDLQHPDLKAHLTEGINVVTQGKTPPQDDVGHGTHVAGVISAIVNNEEGVAGMTWFNPVMPVKVLDSSGSGSTYAVAQGVIWAADHGAKVINMSLGNYADAKFLHDAIKYAYDKDIVLIAASGNDNTERPGYPAAYPEVFAVAASDSKKNKASFSNYGNYIDVAAPGVGIPSTYPNNQYAALSGTSMASPHVAALAALIRSTNPLLRNTEVMDILRRSAVDAGPPGKDKYFGYGQIDVVRALQLTDQSRRSLSYWPDWLMREFERITTKYGA